MRKPLIAVLAIPALLAAACSGPSAGSSPPSPSPSLSEAPAVHCPNPHGGVCLGELDAGTYATSDFEPAITYTVPSGWINAEDLPGNFLLFRQDDPQDGSYLGIFQGVRAASANCYERAQPDVGSTPADLVAWYQSVPELEVSAPVPVTVGGLEGLQIDITMKPDSATCVYDGVEAVPVIIGSGISQLHHVVVADLDLRLVLLSWQDTNVTVEITSVREQHSAEEYRALVQPILDSLVFEQ